MADSLADSLVTYEVWERNLNAGETRRRTHETGFNNPRIPQKIADDYNADYVERCTRYGNPVAMKWIVVKATTTFEEL